MSSCDPLSAVSASSAPFVRRHVKSSSVRLAVALIALIASGHFVSAQSTSDYVIGPQDVVTIQVFDQADLGGKYSVEADGTFSFPLIGRVKAGGQTLRGLEQDLKSKLADGYFRNPQITVAIEQYRSQRIFVMGEVRQPGPVPLTGGMTLIEALARAGSTTATASGEVAIVRTSQGDVRGPVLPDPNGGSDVFRASIKELEGGALSKNLELRDGDTVFVPRAETIYVFGQVRTPGAYGVQANMTVLQALSLAGGVTEHGATGRIRVVRTEDGTKKEIKVKLTDLVRPGDTVIVPERYF
jgi:polysaccharide export outer membrane protein